MGMKKKVLWGTVRIALVLLLAWGLCKVFSNYLDGQITELYRLNQTQVNAANGTEQKDKGAVLFAETFRNDTGMLVMGSSELGSPVPENPKNLLPNQYYTKNVSYTGHAYVQNALQAMLLGANSDTVDGSDVVIVESIQWFMGGDATGFLSNFSELSFYRFLQNGALSEESKEYLCNRFIEKQESGAHNVFDELTRRFSEGSKLHFIGQVAEKAKKVLPDFFQLHVDYPQTYTLAKLYTSDSFLGRLCYYITCPYYSIRNEFLSLKDKFSAYRYLKDLGGQSGAAITKTVDWDALYKTAEKECEAACTNNDLYVYDEYYTKYLAERFDDLKDVYTSESATDPKEWDDFHFFLLVCKELGIEPYVVIMSTNGRYYDYVGFNAEKRTEFYNAMESTVENAGYEALNLKDWEYEPYFYCDVMHLGWKGWTYVTENIVNHFAK